MYAVSLIGLILLALFGWQYLGFNMEKASHASSEYQEVTFYISDTAVQLENGVAEAVTALGGASVTTVRYFGNELWHDIDGDGADDVVFLITQETGGSGTFFYLVGALQKEKGFVGTHAVYIGDRIAPQPVTAGDGRQVVVNYVDRVPGAPMSEAPSVGKSLFLLLDTDTRTFGEVVQNFEGESR